MIYHYLDHLIGAYLNQDYELSGDTIEEVVQCFLNSEHQDAARGLAEDCRRFLADQAEPEKEFEQIYGADFTPRLWGVTTVSFLTATIKQANARLNNI